MYLCQQVDVIGAGIQRRWKLIIYRATLDPTGRPVWKLYQTGQEWHNTAVPRANGWRLRPTVPFMSDAAPDKRVTGKQAERLTGVSTPVSLDRLTELLADETDEIQNYVKPKPAAKPAPTPADEAHAEYERCAAMVDKWENEAVKANRRAKKWQRRANYYARRFAALEAGNPPPDQPPNL